MGLIHVRWNMSRKMPGFGSAWRCDKVLELIKFTLPDWHICKMQSAITIVSKRNTACDVISNRRNGRDVSKTIWSNVLRMYASLNMLQRIFRNRIWIHETKKPSTETDSLDSSNRQCRLSAQTISFIKSKRMISP